MRPFTDLYGDRPAHLVVLLGCVAVAGYAATFLLGDPALFTVLVWFVGAALAHDLLLFPLCAAADRVLVGRSRKRSARRAVPVVNYLRLPALCAGLTLLMFLPGIIGQGGATHFAATGLDQQPYLGRWLGLTGLLFATSAAVYLVRVVSARASRSPAAAADRRSRR